MKGRLIIILAVFLPAGFIAGYFLAQRIDVNNVVKNEINLHHLSITQQEYYDDFFAGDIDCQNNYDESIKGLIVNHHLLAGNFIAQTLCRAATDRQITVVLLSPNHFNNGNGQIIASLFDWQTPSGSLRADKALASLLVKKKIAIAEEAPFNFEHGIYNIIPFIKKTIPNAKIIPIIVKDSVLPGEKDSLINFLGRELPPDSLIVASLDFSHYLTSDEADKFDEQTLTAINKLDLEGLKSLNLNARPDNVDSKAVLEIFLSAMRQRQAVNFELVAHSNSVKLIGDPSLKETTSYIDGAFLKK